MATETETETETQTNGTIYHVPVTVAEMKAPRPTDIITEASNFLRNHWDDCRPYWEAIAGTGPTIAGSRRFDEAGLTFEVQKIAGDNGFKLLAGALPAKLWTVLRFAYRRNTGVSVKLLEKQNARFRIEHKLPIRAAEAAE